MSIEIVYAALTVFIVISFNWLAGFIEATFVSPRYETKESTVFLAKERLNLVKLIRITEKFQSQSNVLVDTRSFLRKIYSKRSLLMIVVDSEIEKNTRVYWVEFIRYWNVSIRTKRRINYHLETNTDLIKMMVSK